MSKNMSKNMSKRTKKNVSDHDILLQLTTKMDNLRQSFDNHLAHHFTYTILMFSTVIGALGTIFWYIIIQT